MFESLINSVEFAKKQHIETSQNPRASRSSIANTEHTYLCLCERMAEDIIAHKKFFLLVYRIGRLFGIV